MAFDAFFDKITGKYSQDAQNMEALGKAVDRLREAGHDLSDHSQEDTQVSINTQPLEKKAQIESGERRQGSSTVYGRRKFLEKAAKLGLTIAAGAYAGERVYNAATQNRAPQTNEPDKGKEVLRTKPYNVVIIGDSNSNPSQRAVGETGWTKKLEHVSNRKEFSPGEPNPLKKSFSIDVQAIGIDGTRAGIASNETPDNYLNETRMKDFAEIVEKRRNREQQTDLVVIMLGTNNIWNSETQADGANIEPSDKFVAEFREMVESIQDNLTPRRILVIAIPPMFPYPGNSVSPQMAEKVNDYNQALKDAMETEGMYTWGKTGTKIEFLDPFASPGRRLMRGVDFNDDGVHLLEPGSQIIAEAVAKYIDQDVREEAVKANGKGISPDMMARG